MGEGMVSNILEAGGKVFTIKHKNSKPIERVKIKGAIELDTIQTLAKKCEFIILCLPNSVVVKKHYRKIKSYSS